MHHEFVSGVHGQKLDFDGIPDESNLYAEWVTVSADDISRYHASLPRFVVGVANGTNRLALSVAESLSDTSDEEVTGLVSAKDPDNDKVLFLPEDTISAIASESPGLVVVTEDAGTKGTNSVQVAEQVLLAGAKDVIVQVTWQRNPTLVRLEEKGIKYRAIIKHFLPDFESGACQTDPKGFCARGWEFIPRD